jgi:hypothetical protein
MYVVRFLWQRVSVVLISYVIFLDDKEMQNAKITIYLERQGEKRSTIADAKGKFCFEVQPGKYTLYPIISNIGAQKQEGLVHPRNYDIHVSNEPILNLNFSRPRLNIEG